MEHKFKCKDEVIFRYNDGSGRSAYWTFGIFSHYQGENLVAIGNMVYSLYCTEVLPYEGNERLVGTTDEPEEEIIIKEGEYVFFSLEMDSEAYEWEFGMLYLCRPNERHGIQVCSESDSMQYPQYIVPFSKFNPNDMEATKKEILTVRNGKLVKANLK